MYIRLIENNLTYSHSHAGRPIQTYNNIMEINRRK